MELELSLTMRLISLYLIISAFGQASEGAEILIRKKALQVFNGNAFRSMTQSDAVRAERRKIEKLKFETEAEKKVFVNSLDPSDVEWEENQIYRATDYELNSELQAELKEDLKADPLFGNQWSIFPLSPDPTKVSGVDIDAVRAWKITTGSDNVIVYVMDSGIISGPEPDLKNRVVASFDGLHPGQFPEDENGHGTHVTSIIGAIGDNDYGLRGVVPGKLQMGAVRFLDASNKGSTDIAAAGLDFIAKDFQSRKKSNPSLNCIVSNSWDGGYSKFLEDRFTELRDLGCLFVTSAGNNGRNNDQAPDYPCNFQGIQDVNLCVGATDDRDKRAYFSSYGAKSVHLYAPGTGIYGIVKGSTQGNQWLSGREAKNGTSQAVPHVSGVAALIWSANEKLSAREVQSILIQTVDRLPGADQEVVSGGRLNAYRAVLMATGQDTHLADRATQPSSEGGGGCALVASQKFSTASRGMGLALGLFGAALLLLISNARSRFGRALRVRVRLQTSVDEDNR